MTVITQSAQMLQGQYSLAILISCKVICDSFAIHSCSSAIHLQFIYNCIHLQLQLRIHLAFIYNCIFFTIGFNYNNCNTSAIHLQLQFIYSSFTGHLKFICNSFHCTRTIQSYNWFILYIRSIHQLYSYSSYLFICNSFAIHICNSFGNSIAIHISCKVISNVCFLQGHLQFICNSYLFSCKSFGNSFTIAFMYNCSSVAFIYNCIQLQLAIHLLFIYNCDSFTSSSTIHLHFIYLFSYNSFVQFTRTIH